MSLTTTLKAAKVFPADIKRIKELTRGGMSATNAVDAVIASAQKDLEEVRDDLRAKGYAVDVKRIEKSKEK